MYQVFVDADTNNSGAVTLEDLFNGRLKHLTDEERDIVKAAVRLHAPENTAITLNAWGRCLGVENLEDKVVSAIRQGRPLPAPAHLLSPGKAVASPAPVGGAAPPAALGGVAKAIFAVSPTKTAMKVQPALAPAVVRPQQGSLVAAQSPPSLALSAANTLAAGRVGPNLPAAQAGSPAPPQARPTLPVGQGQQSPPRHVSAPMLQ